MIYEEIFDVGTILIVEDDVLAAETVIDRLSTLGHKDTLLATNLDEAQGILAHRRIDLALLDVKLAKGVRTIDLGRSLSKAGVRVVFMSGFNRMDMIQLTTGFEFIEKPISLPRLKAALQRAIIRQPSSELATNHI